MIRFLIFISCLYLYGCSGESSNLEDADQKSSTPNSSLESTEIFFEDFESGWGNFIDGGLFTKLSVDDTIIEGTCASIFNDAGVISSFIQRKAMNLTEAEFFNLNFWVNGDNLIDGDILYVDFSDGNEWRVLLELTKGEDFFNDTFTEIYIDVSRQDYTFSSMARIQFRSATAGNSIFIDDISISVMGTLAENLDQDSDYSFDHQYVDTGCSGCHNNHIAIGKSASHLSSLDECQICHKPNDISGWEAFPYYTGTYDHTDMTTGCFDCHNAVLAATKVADHINSSNTCEHCHSTEVGGWSILHTDETYMHEGVTTECVSCHTSDIAINKDATHIPSSDNCGECHTPNQPWENIIFLNKKSI